MQQRQQATPRQSGQTSKRRRAETAVRVGAHTMTADDQCGMSLRDYFAAAALTGILAQSPIARKAGEFVRQAFVCADAMLLARNAVAENDACDTIDQIFVREQNAIGERDRLQRRLDRIREYCVLSAFDDKLEHIIKLAEGALP